MKKLGNKSNNWMLIKGFLIVAIMGLTLCSNAALSKTSIKELCNVDLNNPGIMSDIVSNALTRAFGKKELTVQRFLNNAYDQDLYETGEELAKAAAKAFNVEEKILFEAVQKYKYTNCVNGNYGEAKIDVQPQPQPVNESGCNVDLTLPGQMKNIISNALTLGLGKDGSIVRMFIQSSRGKFETGHDLAIAAANYFNIEENRMFETIGEYKDVNCQHSAIYKAHNISSNNVTSQVITTDESSTTTVCKVDLNKPGEMSDIVSNVLMLGLVKDDSKVREFLQNTGGTFKTGKALAVAAAKEFNVEQAVFFEAIEAYKFINCKNTANNMVVTPIKTKPSTSINSICKIDLSNPAKMSDIVSNALLNDFAKDELKVQQFLGKAYTQKLYQNANDLAKASAKYFKVDENSLFESIEKYKHINCWYQGDGNAADAEVSVFAQNVLIHVVLHELGHGLLRQFDLPTLGNEETLADAFATHYAVTQLPENALQILSSRVRSLMIEATEIPRDKWSVKGEHNSDARRAFQIAALAIAYDQNKYASLAKLVDMNAKDIRKATDYGNEVHSSWERILKPLWMPQGKQSKQVRVLLQASIFGAALESNNLDKLLLNIISSFDWRSQITLSFPGGSGGAGWSRSKRTITVRDQYIHRFNLQDKVKI